MELIDHKITQDPTHESRGMREYLQRELGKKISLKRVRRFMRKMNLKAVYPKPKAASSAEVQNSGWGVLWGKKVRCCVNQIGTKYKGKYVGQFGIAGSFSFFGNKTVTTGEGGMVVTNNDELAKRIRKLKNQGNSETKRYWHDILGYNYRMTNLQAAIGYAQMLRIEKLIEKKRLIASWYRKLLKHPLVVHPIEKTYCTHSYWMYSILLDSSIGRFRDEIMQKLYHEYGIETRPFFYPITLMPMYQGSTNEAFPVLMDFYWRGINLPSSTRLIYDDVKYVSLSLTKMLDKYARLSKVR